MKRSEIDDLFPDIPLLASGGIVTDPTLAMVGEAGPEAVIPLDRFRPQPASVTVNFTVRIDSLTAADDDLSTLAETSRGRIPGKGQDRRQPRHPRRSRSRSMTLTRALIVMAYNTAVLIAVCSLAVWLKDRR